MEEGKTLQLARLLLVHTLSLFDSNSRFSLVSNADAPTRLENGDLVFAKPWEEDQPFPQFLDYVRSQELDPSSPGPSSTEIRYAQTRKHEQYLPCLLSL